MAKKSELAETMKTVWQRQQRSILLQFYNLPMPCLHSAPISNLKHVLPNCSVLHSGAKLVDLCIVFWIFVMIITTQITERRGAAMYLHCAAAICIQVNKPMSPAQFFCPVCFYCCCESIVTTDVYLKTHRLET